MQKFHTVRVVVLHGVGEKTEKVSKNGAKTQKWVFACYVPQKMSFSKEYSSDCYETEIWH